MTQTVLRKLKVITAKIDELFSDNRYGLAETLEALEEIRGDVDWKIGCLKEDARRAARSS